MQDEQYIEDGFNHGYELARLKPDMAKTLAGGFKYPAKPYAIGFTAGVKEWQREQLKSRAKHINRSTPSQKNQKRKDRDREMDRDR